jgi:hypothetical protein
MAFSDSLKDLFDQSLKAGKDFAGKAGAKAQEWGEKGAIKLEIVQLQSRLEKCTERLGAEAYKAFVEHQQTALASNEPAVAGILNEIGDLKAQLEKKQSEYAAAGGN